MTQLEGEARTVREALSAVEQRAAAATAKADVLQRAVAQVCHAVLIQLLLTRRRVAKDIGQLTLSLIAADVHVIIRVLPMLFQAEERNATLEMQASARPAAAADAAADGSATPESRCSSRGRTCHQCNKCTCQTAEASLPFICPVRPFPGSKLRRRRVCWPQTTTIRMCREAALGAEVRLLREELGSAQEAAASAAGHAKQYQALATSSDEALRSMQARQTGSSPFPDLLQALSALLPTRVVRACLPGRLQAHHASELTWPSDTPLSTS
jgi:hypothetical protein